MQALSGDAEDIDHEIRPKVTSKDQHYILSYSILTAINVLIIFIYISPIYVCLLIFEEIYIIVSFIKLYLNFKSIMLVNNDLCRLSDNENSFCIKYFLIGELLIKLL